MGHAFYIWKYHTTCTILYTTKRHDPQFDNSTLDDFAQHFGQLTSGSKGPEGLEPRIKNRGPIHSARSRPCQILRFLGPLATIQKHLCLIPEDVFRECILGSALHDHISCWALYERAVSTADAETPSVEYRRLLFLLVLIRELGNGGMIYNNY